ncbi:MAG: hydroxymethylbilane synthase [bacterium]
MNRIKIGTRASRLALWQTHWVRERLSRRRPHTKFDVVTIKTKGDRILNAPLSKIGDKGLFTKEIEEALLAGEIDLAVHSLKDVPTQLPEGLTLGAVTERASPADALIAAGDQTLDTLPQGAKIATSSLRRKAQLLNYRPDFEIVQMRGNVETRLRKFEGSDLDGLVGAYAGLQRLGLSERISQIIPLYLMLPAVGQGALALEIREEDSEVAKLVTSLSHEGSFLSITAERSFLRALEGGCQIPIGAFGRIESGALSLDGLIANLDGTRTVRDRVAGKLAEAEELGVTLALKLIEQGGKDILDEVRSQL